MPCSVLCLFPNLPLVFFYVLLLVMGFSVGGGGGTGDQERERRDRKQEENDRKINAQVKAIKTVTSKAVLPWINLEKYLSSSSYNF